MRNPAMKPRSARLYIRQETHYSPEVYTRNKVVTITLVTNACDHLAGAI